MQDMAQETAWIQQAQNHDLAAFNRLVLLYQNVAFRVAYRLLGDEERAADAVQDSFIKAYRKLHQYRGGQFRSWLLRIVTNSCYDMLRSKARHPTTSLDNMVVEQESSTWLLDPAESVEQQVLRQEVADFLQEAITTLPPNQRIAVTLCDVEGLDYQEISDVTGWALGTVKSRLSRGRAKLREYISAQRPELNPVRRRSTGA